MNIIKLNNVDSSITEISKELYDAAFKGRYCFVLNKITGYNVETQRAEFAPGLVTPIKPSDYVDEYYEKQYDEVSGIYNYVKIPGLYGGEGYTIVYSVPSNPTESDPDFIKLVIPGVTKEDYVNMCTKGGLTTDGAVWFSYDENKLRRCIEKYSSELFKDTKYYERQNDKINRLYKYDVSLNDLRNYRTKFAEIYHSGYTGSYEYIDQCPRVLTVLNYYMDGMVDDTVESLRLMKKFAKDDTTVVSKSSCGCNSNGLTQINTSFTSNCDAERIYRRQVKSNMKDVFTDIEIWKKMTVMQKSTVDEIVDLTKALAVSDLSIFGRGDKLDLNYCCGQAGNIELLREDFVKKIKDIAEAFDCILKEQWDRLSFIKFQLNNFVELYEYLQWSSDQGQVIVSTDENWE